MSKPLTVKSIDAVQPGLVRAEVPDGGLVGLYLVVQPSGAKSWAIRYPHGGRRRKMTIGSYPLFGLADARKVAGSALRTAAEGRDPSIERANLGRKAEPKITTVEDAFAQFMKRHSELRNRPSTVRENRRFIAREVVPKWGKKDIRSVGRADVIDLIDSMMDRSIPQSANRVHALLRKAFNWFVERGVIERSPCANVRAPAASVSRDRVLSADELRNVWSACNRIGWPFGPMIQLLILTGQRREEVAGAVWEEFSLSIPDPVWTIPKERSKTKIANTVWLTPLALDILGTLPRIPDASGKARFVLTTTGESSVSGFSRGKTRLDKAIATALTARGIERGSPIGTAEVPWRLHDLRRTVASGMASLKVEPHVVEKVLNHSTGGIIRGVAAVYNRHDYAEARRQAFFAWAEYLQREIVSEAQNGEQNSGRLGDR